MDRSLEPANPHIERPRHIVMIRCKVPAAAVFALWVVPHPLPLTMPVR